MLDPADLILAALPLVLGTTAIALAVVDHRRAPEPGHGWFIAALVAFAVAAIPFHPYGFSYETADNAYPWRIASALIIALPTFLLHVVGVLCGVTRSWILRLSDLIGATCIAWVLLMPTFPGVDHEPSPWYFVAAFTTFGIHYVLAMLLSVRQLARAARGGIGPARTRGRLLAVTLATFGTSYLIWFASPGPVAEAFMTALAALGGIAFWLAVRAPRRLFELVSREEHDPSQAIAQLMQSTHVLRDLPAVLDSTVRAWGLVAAAVRAGDGSIVEAVGSSPLASTAARSTRTLIVESRLPGGISVEVTSMSLTPGLRRRDRDQLALLATYIQLAFDRERAIAREHAAAQEAAAASRTLELANDRLEQADAVTDRCLAMVTRELREPVAALLGLTRATETDWEQLPTAQLRPLQQLVARRTERVAGTVEQLLLAASIEDGTLLRGRERCDVRDLLLAAARHGDVATPVADDWRHEDDACFVVVTDPLAVRVVLDELVANARHHGEEPVQLRVAHADTHIVLEVADHGPGVRRGFEPALFERFTRDSDTDTPGVGLGLAIARELAESVGASLDYVREAGRTVFRLRVPITS